MAKKILVISVFILVCFSLYVASQPSEFVISRSIEINASTAKIFPYINNSQKTNEWMPWKESDPKAVMNYSGPAEGVGSKASWDSSGSMGTGEALVVESIENKSVKTQLNYTKPMNMSQLAEISMTEAPNGAVMVTWSVTGKNSFLGRAVCILVNMQVKVEKEFDKGLNKLKSIMEANTAP